MAYVWDQYREDIKYRLAETGVSPYQEACPREGNTVRVNGLYPRLQPFLFPPAVVRDEGNGNFQDEGYGEETYRKLTAFYIDNETGRDLADQVLHSVAAMDRKKGLTLMDVQMWMAEREIREGIYGDWLREAFAGLTGRQRKVILWYLAVTCLEQHRVSYYSTVLSGLFRKVRIYYDENRDIVYLHLGAEKTAANRKLLDIAGYLFLDLQVKTEVLWEGEQPGIIGVDTCMKIGQISVI